VRHFADDWSAALRSPRATRASRAVTTLLILLATPLFGGAHPARAAMPDPFGDATVRLIEASASGVRFEVLVPEPLRIATDPEGGGFDRIEMDGYAPSGDAGAPALPERVLWVGMPEGAEVTVEATGFETMEWTAVRLEPRVLRPRKEGEGGDPDDIAVVPSMRSGDFATLAASPEYRRGAEPTALALSGGVTGMRAQQVLRVRVLPARYDPQAMRLSIARRIEVTVRFRGGRIGGGAPTEPAFESVYRALLVNYESARAFRSPLGERARRAAAEHGAVRGSASSPLVSAVGFDVAPQWFKVLVDGKGLQRLTADDLQAAGATLAGIDPATLRLFTRPGVPLLEEEAFCDTCGLLEVAIEVTGNGDGRFDAGEAVQFFGLPTSGWRDDFSGPAGASREWLDHPYETRNVYWLTWQANLATSPRRLATRDVAPSASAPVVPPHFAGRLHLEQNQIYRPSLFERGQFWDQWAWFELNDDIGPAQFLTDAPGAITAEPARLRARFWGTTRETAFPRDYTLADHYQRAFFNGVALQERAWSGFSRLEYDTTAVWMRETGNQLVAQAIKKQDALNPLRNDAQALMFWELYYRRRLVPSADQLEFESPETTGTVAYVASPWSLSGASSVRLFDVSNPVSPVELVGFALRDTVSGRALHFHDTVAGRTLYFAASAARARRPRVEAAEVRNLSAPAAGADYLVVTYDEFEPQAERLATLRRRVLPKVANPTAAVVQISDVLAWYSGGRMDPTALRNFLYDLATSGRWAKVPTYVTLFGDASYDFKNILRLAPAGRPAALVPAYVHGYSGLQYMTDDWLADIDLGMFDPPIPGQLASQSQVPDFFIGRLPANSASEASTLVDAKIIPYDERPSYGEWRNRILLAADDTTQGFSPDPLRGIHMLQSELLENNSLPPDLDRQKLYLIQYPFGTGSEKPQANQEAKRRLNEGALLWNFIGHGNPFKMADENLFIISDLPALTNLDRLTFCVAASCDIGKFDDAVLIGLGEALVKSPAGGAIGAFSSTDIAFSSQNAALNNGIFRTIFAKSAEGYANSLGEACYLVKRRADASENDRKYALQGDPATRLGSPRYDVRLRLFDDETGESLVDSLPRGRRVRIEAEVHGTHDTTLTDLRTDFDGTAEVWISDSAPVLTYTSFSTTQSYTYNPGGVFRGDVAVMDGRATARFYVPLEAAAGPRARARVYVYDAILDGSGSLTPQVLAGAPSETDTVPPTISLRFDGGATTVPPGAALRIGIEDAHGINITGRTESNAITIRFDDGARVDLTELFRYDPGSYTRGTIVYPLPPLATGNHEVEVTAADNFAQGILGRQNRARASLAFTVSPAAAATTSAFNFPNPFRPGSGTNVIVDGVGQAADVEVRFYTVGGTLVRVLTTSSAGGQVQVGWDGRDESGAEVANGVYLYQVTVRPITGGNTVTLEGRAAAAR
jgi:hypothetical protein